MQKWIDRLEGEEAVIASVAHDTYRKFVRPTHLVGGCYLTSFFLHSFLRRERGVKTDLMVGWINDGTGSTMASHAWIEYRGKKTDIALTLTEHSEIQLPGPLIILGEELLKGKGVYTYHLEPSQEAVEVVSRMRRELPAEYGRALAAKEKEHVQMQARSRDPALVDAYLDDAPTDRNYAAIARIIST